MLKLLGRVLFQREFPAKLYYSYTNFSPAKFVDYVLTRRLHLI